MAMVANNLSFSEAYKNANLLCLCQDEIGCDQVLLSLPSCPSPASSPYLGYPVLMAEDNRKEVDSNNTVYRLHLLVTDTSLAKAEARSVPKSVVEEKYILPTGEHGEKNI